MYHQDFNISLTLVGNKFVDHSDVVEASPVGAAATTSSFLTRLQRIRQRQMQDETRTFKCWDLVSYIRGLTVD